MLASRHGRTPTPIPSRLPYLNPKGGRGVGSADIRQTTPATLVVSAPIFDLYPKDARRWRRRRPGTSGIEPQTIERPKRTGRPLVSDVGRLPEAAAKLDRRADWEAPKQRDEDRATAALLRAIQRVLGVLEFVEPPPTPQENRIWYEANLLAAAVLGLPEDNERTAEDE